MNFDYSTEEQQLKNEARRFLADAASMESVRAILDDSSRPYDTKLWASIAEMGWLGAIIPEADGGLGLTTTELCALCEELGRALAPIPFSSSVYLFTQAIVLMGSSAQRSRLLPNIAAGGIIGCVASSEGPGLPETKANVQDGKLNGVKIPVTDGDVADYAIVSAADSDGISLYLADMRANGVNAKPLKTIDPTRSSAEITFTNVEVEPFGEPGQGTRLLTRLFDHAAIYIAFEQIGGADRIMEMARDYALERYAFGRAIGSFQAVKHRIATMYIRNQVARSNAYYGAWALGANSDELPKAAAASRIAASEAFRFAAKEAIEVFGGIGTTWETDCHLFYRRAKQLALMLGPTALWREKLASELESSS